jgi:hypothetical protein
MIAPAATARVAFAAALSVSTACFEASPETGSAGAAITNGVPDDGDPAVVALVRGERVFCTGTLVSPTVVVTAGHCIGQPDVAALFGTAVGDGELRDVIDQRAHPDFDAVTLSHDIGVVLLAEPAPESIEPIAMRVQPLSASAVGAPLRLVGFGLTAADPTAESGRKREGVTILDALDPLSFTFVPSPSQTCMGDSGGPAFMDFGGVEQLVGVTSAGDQSCEEYGRDTRVDAFVADFVLPYIELTSAVGLAAGERCFVAGNCASGDCVRPADSPSIGYCAAPCAADADCPGEMSCDASAAACRYPMPSPGAFATACAADTDCDSRVCATPDGYAEPMCTSRCIPQVGASCPEDTECVEQGSAEGGFVCAPAEVAGGCAVGAQVGETPLGALVLALLALALHRRRRVRIAAILRCGGSGRSRRCHRGAVRARFGSRGGRDGRRVPGARPRLRTLGRGQGLARSHAGRGAVRTRV